MPILVAALLLLILPLAMALTRFYRPRFGYQWIVAVLGALGAWLLVLISQPRLLAGWGLSSSVFLLEWKPRAFFPVLPGLLIDEISWPFAMALATMPLTVLLTSVARLETTTGAEADEKKALTADWRAWAATLALSGLGLVAVTAANPLTLLLSWAALDMVETVFLLSQQRRSAERERIVIAFSGRVAGIAMLLLAGIVAWSKGNNLVFTDIPPQAGLYLLLACGLRLGVLPLHLPIQAELVARRGLGTSLRLVAWAASLALLARAASVIEIGSFTVSLLGIGALAALFGGSSWLAAQNEVAGRPFWILGTASLAIAAALLSRPDACLAWGLASLLPGGMLFTFWPRHRYLIPLAALGLTGLTGLPFTPSWNGMGIYRFEAAPSSLSNAGILPVISIFYLVAQALLLAGYLRHMLAAEDEVSAPIQRWVWLVYPSGLALPILVHFGLSWGNLPEIEALPWSAWVGGPAATILGIAIWRLRLEKRSGLGIPRLWQWHSVWGRILSLNWLYRFLWGGIVWWEDW